MQRKTILLIIWATWLSILVILLLDAGTANAQLTLSNGNGPNWKPRKHRMTKLDTCVGLKQIDWPDDSLPPQRVFYSNGYKLQAYQPKAWINNNSDTVELFYPALRFIRMGKYLYKLDSNRIIHIN